MGKKKKTRELTDFEKGMIVADCQNKIKQDIIAKKLGISQFVVSKIWKKFKKTGGVENKNRSGRPRKTNAKQDHYIKLLSLRDRNLSSQAISKQLLDKEGKRILQARSIRSRLVEAGLPARRPRKKPLLKKFQKKNRLRWALAHNDWQPSDWARVLWSDESPFHLFCDNGRLYVRRRPWEEYAEICLKPTVKFGGGHINVWGCFSSKGVGPLYRINGIMNGAMYREILKNYMSPHLVKLGISNFIFQQDNDPKHKSKVVTNYLENKKVRVLSWPSQSPDLNPIENIWGHIKRKISKDCIKASSLDDVFMFVQKHWEAVDDKFIQNLVLSMPRRIKKVIKNKGGHIKY